MSNLINSIVRRYQSICLVMLMLLSVSGPITAQIDIIILDERDSVPMTGAVLVAQNKNYVYSSAADDKGKIVIPEADLKLLVGANYRLYSTGYEPMHLSSIKDGQRYYMRGLFISSSEVVVTGQYTPRSISESVHNIKVIDKKKMEAMGAVTLDDVLYNELFVRLSQDNILGAGMSLQGVSGENVKILRDGVPVIGRMNGNIDLSQLNLSDIERIEIIEGPLSVTYGTNALGGTINLISKKAKKRLTTGGAQFFTDNTGNYNANVNFQTSVHNHAFTANAYRNFFDGWSPDEKDYFDFRKQIADENRWKQWKPKEQYGAELGYNYQFKKWNVGLRSGMFTETILNRGLPSKPYFEKAFDDQYYTKRFDNAVQFNYRGENERVFSGFVAYNQYTRHKNTYIRDLTTLSEMLTPTKGDQDTTQFFLLNSRATYSAKLNEWFKYEWGYDVNVETAGGERIDQDFRKQNDYAMFASAEMIAAKGLVVRPALRYSYNTRYNVPLIPSLNLKYSIGKYDVRASAARGFRAPTLKELFFYFVDINHNIIGNRDLMPEDSWYYSLQGTRRFSFAGGNLKLTAGSFMNYITNLISLAQINNMEYSYINVGKYSAHGGNFEGVLQLGNLENTLGASITGRYNQLSEYFIDTEKYFYTPELRWNVSYNWIKQQLTFSSFLKFQGKLQGYALQSDDSVGLTYINPYTTWDISVSKKYWKQRMTTTAGIRNLLDVTNVTSISGGDGVHSGTSYNVPVSTGRMFFVSWSFHLSKQKDA
jgi:outer membrane receptor for ferrienterochelin and colicins